MKRVISSSQTSLTSKYLSTTKSRTSEQTWRTRQTKRPCQIMLLPTRIHLCLQAWCTHDKETTMVPTILNLCQQLHGRMLAELPVKMPIKIKISITITRGVKVVDSNMKTTLLQAELSAISSCKRFSTKLPRSSIDIVWLAARMDRKLSPKLSQTNQALKFVIKTRPNPWVKDV